MADLEEPYRRGMVVFAHADDAEWGCSGTVAKWCAEGWQVVYVVCTDGSKGSSDPNMAGQELAQLRREEQQNAAKVLGVEKVVFLGYEDSMLEPSLELRKDIAREIRRYRPDVLICESPTRRLEEDGWIGHPDHLAAGEAAMSAVFPTARDRLTFPELLDEGFEPHHVRELWVMDSSEANNYLDISEYIDTAIDALKEHKSQVGDEAVDVHMKSWRGSVGQKVGFQYAEGYRRFRLG
jgi:LmbE family N-acetylglucosaminyl deacetylase